MDVFFSFLYSFSSPFTTCSSSSSSAHFSTITAQPKQQNTTTTTTVWNVLVLFSLAFRAPHFFHSIPFLCFLSSSSSSSSFLIFFFIFTFYKEETLIWFFGSFAVVRENTHAHTYRKERKREKCTHADDRKHKMNADRPRSRAAATTSPLVFNTI